MPNEITTPKAKASVHDGILECSFMPGAVLEVDDAKELIAKMRAAFVPNNEKYPTLGDMTNLGSATRQARDYFASPEGTSFIAASALLVKTPVARMIGNFYMSVNKPPYPIKMFTSRDEALTWLQQFTKTA